MTLVASERSTPRRRPRAPSAFAWCLLACFALYSGQASAGAQELPGSVPRGRTLRVGGDWGYPPFEYIDETGRPAGFNVDIVHEVGRLLGVEMVVNLSRWSEARERLAKGELDFLAGMYRSDLREAEVDFSVPYFINAYRVFALRGAPVPADVLSGRIAVQDGDLGHEYLKDLGYGSSLVVVADWKDLFQALTEGKADVVVSSTLQARAAIDSGKFPPIAGVGDNLFYAEYCMAVRDGDADLLAFLNEGLAELRDTGRYELIYAGWFGTLGVEEEHDTHVALNIAVSAALATVLAAAAAWIASLSKRLRSAAAALATESRRGGEAQARLQRALAELEDARLETSRAAEEKAAFVDRVVRELSLALVSVRDSSGGELVGKALDEAETLLADLLAATKVGHTELAIRHEAFSFPELCAEIEALERPLAEERGLAFRFSAQGAGTAVGDAERIKKVVANLCANAIRYTARGEVELVLGLGDAELYVSVNDTGPGISSVDQARLFKPILKEACAEGSRERGLGLGLAVVKSIVDAMGGSIRYETHPSIGTRFEVSLPLGPAEGREADSLSPSEALTPSFAPFIETVPEEPPARGFVDLPHMSPYGTELGRAIVAEDEAINRLYLKRLLENAGYEVTQAVDGEVALEAASSGTWSFILMDVSMPRMNGLESTRRIRELETARGSTRVPIVALTAHAYAEDKQACAQAGMDGFLSKPFTESALWAELRKVLRKEDVKNE